MDTPTPISDNQNKPLTETPVTSPTTEVAPPEVESPKPNLNKKILMIIAVVLLLLGTGSAAAYFLVFKNQTAQPSPTPSITTESTPDPTADWKTYTNKKVGLTFKYPKDYTPLENPSSVNLRSPLLTQEDGGRVFKDGELGLDVTLNTEENYESLDQFIANIKKSWGNIFTTETKTTVADKEAESLKFEDAPGGPGELYLLLHNGYGIEIAKYPQKTSRQQEFDQILSTFKFVDSQETTAPQVNGASLENIKYTLPSTWEGKLSEGTLLLSASGGGYLSIKVYNYNGTTGRREYYCQVQKVCTDSSTFTETKVGNITGYKADSLDNSGGGPEYFGAKGDKFYVVSTYSPPSPNEYEKTYQQVLDSLVF